MTGKVKPNRFKRLIKYLVGISPKACRECYQKFVGDEKTCLTCGNIRRIIGIMIFSRSCVLLGLGLIALSGVIYLIEVWLEPYTHDMYVAAASMNYEKDNYAGTIAGVPCALGFFVLLIAYISARLGRWFQD